MKKKKKITCLSSIVSNSFGRLGFLHNFRWETGISAESVVKIELREGPTPKSLLHQSFRTCRIGHDNRWFPYFN